MSTQATQSNNAAGRRTLPSSFFAPLQTLGRYIDRQKGDEPDPAEGSTEDRHDDAQDGDVSSWRDWTAASTASADTVPDPEAVRGAISRLVQGAQWQQTQAETGQTAHVSAAIVKDETAGFAEVARRVWSEASTGPTAPDRAMPQRPGPEEPDPHYAELAIPSMAAQGRPSSSPIEVPGHGPRPVSRPTAPQHISVATISDTRPGSAEAHALAHDAGNLLSALRLYSELLCFSGVLHERHRHYAEDLKLLSLRSERLIDRLLQLAEQVATTERGEAVASTDARPLATPIDLSFNIPITTPDQIAFAVRRPGPELLGSIEAGDSVSTSLADVLMRTRGLLGTIAHGALVVDLGPLAGLPVAVPSEALERVLVNLVSNAAQAVRDGGAIRIRAGLAGAPDSPVDPSIRQTVETVVLTVDDSGCGMSDAQLRSALGEHARGGSPAVTAAPRSDLAAGERRHGLGLSIVRQLVAENGGRFFIHSRPGTGTRIEIEWPAAGAITETKQPASTQRAFLASVPLRSSTASSYGGPTQAALQRPDYAATAQGAVA